MRSCPVALPLSAPSIRSFDRRDRYSFVPYSPPPLARRRIESTSLRHAPSLAHTNTLDEHPRCAGGRASRTASRGAPEQGGFQGCRSPREVNEHGTDAIVVDGLRIQAFKRPRWSYALDLPLADVRAATAPEVSFAAWAAPRRAPKRTRALAGRAADDAGPAPKKRADADDDEGLPAGWRVVAHQRERNRVTCAMSPEGLVFTSVKAARESLLAGEAVDVAREKREQAAAALRAGLPPGWAATPSATAQRFASPAGELFCSREDVARRLRAETPPPPPPGFAAPVLAAGPWTIARGARVEARWSGGDAWYPGAVVAIQRWASAGAAVGATTARLDDADATFDVDYDDGAVEREVPARLVRPPRRLDPRLDPQRRACAVADDAPEPPRYATGGVSHCWADVGFDGTAWTATLAGAAARDDAGAGRSATFVGRFATEAEAARRRDARLAFLAGARFRGLEAWRDAEPLFGRGKDAPPAAAPVDAVDARHARKPLVLRLRAGAEGLRGVANLDSLAASRADAKRALARLPKPKGDDVRLRSAAFGAYDGERLGDVSAPPDWLAAAGARDAAAEAAPLPRVRSRAPRVAAGFLRDEGPRVRGAWAPAEHPRAPGHRRGPARPASDASRAAADERDGVAGYSRLRAAAPPRLRPAGAAPPRVQLRPTVAQAARFAEAARFAADELVQLRVYVARRGVPATDGDWARFVAASGSRRSVPALRRLWRELEARAGAARRTGAYHGRAHYADAAQTGDLAALPRGYVPAAPPAREETPLLRRAPLPNALLSAALLPGGPPGDRGDDVLLRAALAAEVAARLRSYDDAAGMAEEKRGDDDGPRRDPRGRLPGRPAAAAGGAAAAPRDAAVPGPAAAAGGAAAPRAAGDKREAGAKQARLTGRDFYDREHRGAVKAAVDRDRLDQDGGKSRSALIYQALSAGWFALDDGAKAKWAADAPEVERRPRSVLDARRGPRLPLIGPTREPPPELATAPEPALETSGPIYENPKDPRARWKTPVAAVAKPAFHCKNGHRFESAAKELRCKVCGVKDCKPVAAGAPEPAAAPEPVAGS